jgi:DNA-directed RNA polymerase subunit L
MKEKLLSKPKILFVALGSSIHTARWIKQITDQGWDIHLFICDHSIHNILKEYEKDKKINIYGKIYHPVEYKIKIPIYVGRDSLIIRTIKRVLRLVINVIINPVILLPLLHNISLSLKQTHKMLASVISEIKPDIIHSLELQHNAYLTLKAKKIIRGQFPTWIVTNWGADIHYFGRFEEHRDMIKQVLASCDYYSSECHRDITLASNLGFKGIFLPVLPNAGGFNIEEIKKLKQDDKPSSRKTIAVKGAESWVYKGLHILKAIELCKELYLK